MRTEPLAAGKPAPETQGPETLSNDIRVLRLLAGEMTQADLGARVGLTRQTIAAIEQGRYAPSLEVAFRIAYVFGKRLDEVFHWAPGSALAGKQVELASPGRWKGAVEELDQV